MTENAYCGACAADSEIHPKAGICSECGITQVKSKRKSPVIAALLSLIIPGLGQVYAGNLYRGLALFALLGLSFCLMALIIGFFTFFATWIFAVSDAYNMVKNKTTKSRKRQM